MLIRKNGLKLLTANVWKCTIRHAHSDSLGITFFGTDGFSIHFLRALLTKYRLAAVVTAAKKCPVEVLALQCNIPHVSWPIDRLPANTELGVVVSFGHLIPLDVIRQFPYGILNVHPSLLPRWRGAAPLVHTLLSGDRQTGVTIIHIKPDYFDRGPILVQRSCEVDEAETLSSLAKKLSILGTEMLLDVLVDVPTHLQSLRDQPSEGVTSAPRLMVRAANIDWFNSTPSQIDRQYKALGEMYSLRSSWQGKAIKLHNKLPTKLTNDILFDIEKAAGMSDNIPGKLVFSKKYNIVCVKCKDGWVTFQDVVFRKTMSAQAFYNGYISKTPSSSIVLDSLSNGLEKFSHWKDKATQ